MTYWRPAQTIRIKTLGLHWREGRLLAACVFNDDGTLKGVRPLGGTVEFGETAESALMREFREELGVTATIIGPPLFMENLYHHEGMQGHELLILFPVDLPVERLPATGGFTFYEDSGTACHADWFALDGLDGPNQPSLYPAGLKARLQSAQTQAI
ncbi:NUDIX hydrolase [Thioclava sp. GXIMD4215]|uniref:NUDIX hydrolase n=1 Tax=Thioclava sp. GXIMD4215 TaxID=3131928 RepID=UPI00325113DD